MKRFFQAALLLAIGALAGGWFVHHQNQTIPSGPVVINTQTPASVVFPSEPPSLSPEDPIKVAFEEWSSRPALSGSLVALVILDEKGNVRYGSPLAETALCPASSLKTLTTGAALGLLGPGFRYETKLVGTAEMNPQGVITGDLILVGSGDPTLTIADLEALADAVVASGLKRVEGSLRIEVSVFPGEPASDHWNRGDTGNGYGAGAYGVNVNHNRLTLSFDGAENENEPASFVGPNPKIKDIDWNLRVTTGPADSGDGVMVYSEPYGRRIDVRGSVPLAAKGFSVSAAMPNPPAVALEILRERFKAKGVTFGNRKSNEASNTSVLLASHFSKELPEIIDHLHRVSDNLESQCLFLTMGKLKNDDPARVVKKFWEDAGITFKALRMEDGSGLARATMIRPIDLARVNYAARHASTGPRFYESLSTYLNGKVRSKLGAMSGVKTEVGFLAMPDGREWTFALIGNGLSGEINFWQLRGELLEMLRTSGH
jgi:D-alanyl-D-alanine carboxypeptidase/D-alanyl-D-alanine-endopeptidase (penicillin-binding protein 4)